MKKVAFLLIFCLSLVACNHQVPSEIVAVELKSSQDNLETSLYRGGEYFDYFKQLAMDKSMHSSAYKRVNEEFQVISKMEAEFSRLFSDVEKLKRPFLFQVFKDSLLQKTSNRSFVRLRVIGFSRNGFVNGSELDFDKDEISNLSTEIVNSGKMLFSSAFVETYPDKIRKERGVKLHLPDVDVFNKSSLIERKAFFNDLQLDDQNAAFKIYSDWAESIILFNSALKVPSSNFQKIMLLNALQTMILSARADMYSVIWSRRTGHHYSFNKIVPVVLGPSSGKPGDTIQLKVFIGVYYDLANIEAELLSGVKLKVEEGMAILNYVIPEGANEKLIEGTVSIRNRSGIAKTRPWSKKVIIQN